MSSARKQVVFAGAFSMLMGALICLVGLDVIPAQDGSIHAPRWVLVLCGGVFVAAGLAIFFKDRPLLVSLLGNLIVASFAVIAAWIAFAGPSGQFSGGIPLLPHELNVKIARSFFGMGALLCALILIPGIKQLRKLLTEE